MTFMRSIVLNKIIDTHLIKKHEKMTLKLNKDKPSQLNQVENFCCTENHVNSKLNI